MNIFLDKTANIYRLSEESGDVEEYTLHLKNIPFHIQPMDDSFSEDLSGTRGKDFMGATRLYDIDEFDKVVCEGKEYQVFGSRKYTFMGYKYLELRIKLLEQ